MKKPLAVLLFVILASLTAGCGRQGGSLDIGGVAATPTISPAGGAITSNDTITLASTTPGAAITYTTDGTIPTLSSTAYTAPFTLSANATVSARAFLPPMIPSEVASASFDVTATVATPSIRVATGTYFTTQSVRITCSTPGASILYSTNSLDPATPYTGPVTVSTTTTLRAKATKTGWAQSAVAESVITIKSPVTIDNTSDVGKFSSVALDGSGQPRIAYFDQTNQRLKYAEYNAGTWTIQVVDTGLGGGGGYCALAVDKNGYSHISYYDDTAKSLKYSTNSSGSWVAQTVETGGVGTYSSIAVDGISKAHIAYFDDINSKVKYATNVSGAWTIPVSYEAAVYPHTSIACDPSDIPHISYYDSTNSAYYYLTKVGTSYPRTTINVPFSAVLGNTSGFNSLALDYSTPKILAYDGSLNIAANPGSAWSATAVPSSSGMKDPSLKIDSLSKHHISCYAPVTKTILYMTDSSGTWEVKELEASGSVNTGMYSSIALDSGNYFHISYYDVLNKVLRYITNK